MKLDPAVKATVQAVALAFSLAVVPGSLAQQVPGAPVVAAAGAQAPKPVARLSKMSGDVLASTETGLIAVIEGALFPAGTRVMTMAKSTARIQFEDGCVVSLKPNMRLEIRADQECEQRQAMARLVVLDPATELALEGVLETPTASIPALVLGGALEGAGAAAGVAGAAAIAGGRPGTSVSPS